MDSNFPIVCVAIVIVAMTGCTSESTPDATAPTPTETPAVQSPPKAQSFNNPVVSNKQTSVNAFGNPNLIQSTNPTQREQIALKGRNDPFAQIIDLKTSAVPITITPKTVPAIPPLPTSKVPITTINSPKTVPAMPPLPTSKVPINTPKKSKPPAPLTPVLPKVMPPVVPVPSLESVLPPPPEPDLARGVIVTGVVLVGQQPQAIIKVPSEVTSRYVQAGQRLSDDLLVKRIEMNEGSNPIVILEQYGIEVARMVGEEPVNSAASDPNVEAS